ncbi:MAG: hypothetical protein OEW19_12510 [Acidobacteriota bacterium]|nr:hypothetical protein [Acidobacteriota bacterium]
MWSVTGIKLVRVAAVFTTVLLTSGNAAFAQTKTYEGDIIKVDRNAMTFTVKGTTPGETMEMAFKVDRDSQLVIDGERRLLGELETGDHVIVGYGTSGATHIAKRAERVRTAAPEMTFSGNVVAVDTKAHTFTVKNDAGGKVQEMMFHVSSGERLYIGGEPVLLGQLQKGDSVTVGYESMNEMHRAKHVKKSA